MMREILLVIASIAMQFPTAAGAEARAEPSANKIFQMQNDNRDHPWLHIAGDSGMLERKVQLINRIGLHGLSAPDGARLPEPMAWSRIQRVDEVVTRAAPWRRAGAVTLGLLGAGLGNALGAPTNQGGRMALGGLLLFGGAGGYLGDRYGSRFRSERNWYVADTMLRNVPVDRVEALAPKSEASADFAVLSTCDRIGRNEVFRASGSFGSFQGYAGIAGPEGLEALRVDRHGRGRVAVKTLPARIPWDQIDRVEMRGGNASKGALGGAVLFAGIGALLGAAAIAASSGGAEINVAEGAALGALFLAPVGLVIGGLGGMAARTWVTVYQRR